MSVSRSIHRPHYGLDIHIGLDLRAVGECSAKAGTRQEILTSNKERMALRHVCVGQLGEKKAFQSCAKLLSVHRLSQEWTHVDRSLLDAHPYAGQKDGSGLSLDFGFLHLQGRGRFSRVHWLRIPFRAAATSGGWLTTSLASPANSSPLTGRGSQFFLVMSSTNSGSENIFQ
jgi:hypothetical protein